MMPDKSLRFLLRGLCLVCLALPSIAAAEQAVAVSFEFPDRPAVSITVSYSEVVPLIHDKLAYKVEFCVSSA